MKKPANNTIYFKAFNEDYRAEGVYHELSNSAFRAMVVLQAYANCWGLVCEQSGKGYSEKALCGMLMLNSRTVKRAFMELEATNLIAITDKGAIQLVQFLPDQTERDTGSEDARKRSAGIAKGLATKQVKSALAQRELELVNMVNKAVRGGMKYVINDKGQIVDTKTGEFVPSSYLEHILKDRGAKDESQS